MRTPPPHDPPKELAMNTLTIETAQANRKSLLSSLMGKASRILTGWAPASISMLPEEAAMEALRDLPQDGGADALWFVLGRKVNGLFRYECLESMPHILTAGTTGSGKSVFLNMLIASLVYRHTPETLKIGFVDYARVEFAKYKKLPHLLGSVQHTIEGAAELITDALQEMEHRLDIFEQKEVVSLSEYNKVSKTPLPRWVLVIDEFATLINLARKGSKEDKLQAQIFEKNLNALAAVARKTGIHLILATQKPLANIVDSVLKSNLPARVAFKVSTQTDSRVILDENGAENLTGKGDLLFKSPYDPNLERMRGVYISDDALKTLIQGG